jgi:antitoxin component YwqK of YwqJK toxin-antitoxin module
MKRNSIIAICMVLSLTSVAQTVDFACVNHKYVDKNGYPVTGEFQVKCEDQTNLNLTISNGDISGLAVFYYQEDKVKECGNLVDGERDGDWCLFNKEGKVVLEANFCKGKKNGVWLVYDTDGNLRCKMKYRNGIKAGIWKYWDENGKLLMKKSY